jgi:hypothetical protein
MLINPITGKPYAVGDVLRNYAEAGVLMDAWNFKYRYGDGFIPFWWRDVDGQVGDYIALKSHRFPITILSLPPAPKPKPVADWLAHLQTDGMLFYYDPVYNSRSFANLYTLDSDKNTYARFVCMELKGVKFYATEEDCKAAEGIE